MVIITEPVVVLARHGETEWSKSGQHTSRTDLPLTEHGREEADALRPALAGRHFDLVLTSPRQRARETAAITGFPDAKVDDDLAEWDYGDDEGRTSVQIREDRPDWSLWTVGPQNGETIGQVAARADRVIARIMDTGGTVLLFAHGHILRVLTARWLGLHPELGGRFALATGTLSTLGWEHDRRVIVDWNCHAS